MSFNFTDEQYRILKRINAEVSHQQFPVGFYNDSETGRVTGTGTYADGSLSNSEPVDVVVVSIAAGAVRLRTVSGAVFFESKEGSEDWEERRRPTYLDAHPTPSARRGTDRAGRFQTIGDSAVAFLVALDNEAGEEVEDEAIADLIEEDEDDSERSMWENDSPLGDLGMSVPAFVDHHQSITPGDVAAIVQGGCDSGAWMPAVTYWQALETMTEHGDEVMQANEDMGLEVPQGMSWAGLACHFVSLAVESWAHSAAYELHTEHGFEEVN